MVDQAVSKDWREQLNAAHQHLMDCNDALFRMANSSLEGITGKHIEDAVLGHELITSLASLGSSVERAKGVLHEFFRSKIKSVD